jgi:AMMECR1 domain-containing protein
MTSETDRQRLLQIARDAIVAHVTGVGAPAGEPPSGPGVSKLSDVSDGAFVTIHMNGQLRGCIGNLGVRQPAARLVRD